MIFILLGFVLITAALTIMCAGVGDWNWLNAFLYVLICYVVISLFLAGIFFIVQGTS